MQNSPKKIGIIGAGAIGSYVGAQLIGSMTEVYFLGRKHFQDLIIAHGLTITNLAGKTSYYSPEKINWTINSNELPSLDLVIITTKSHDTLSAIRDLKDKITSHSIILSLQNGISNTKTIADFFPNNQIVTGMVPYNVIQIDKRPHFKQTTSGHIFLNSRIDLMDKIEVEIEPEIVPIQWGKLLKNLNNALNALSNRPLAEQLKDKRERILLSRIMSEALNALKANSIQFRKNSSIPMEFIPWLLKLPDSLFLILSKKELTIDPNARLSMWQDLELNRKTEIEYLNGLIVDLAKKKGLQAPYNQKVSDLIKLAESGELELARSKYQTLLLFH